MTREKKTEEGRMQCACVEGHFFFLVLLFPCSLGLHMAAQ
jgi:hypothetical protein